MKKELDCALLLNLRLNLKNEKLEEELNSLRLTQVKIKFPDYVQDEDVSTYNYTHAINNRA